MKNKLLRAFCFVLIVSFCLPTFGEKVVITGVKWKETQKYDGLDKNGKKFQKAVAREAKIVIPKGHSKSRWALEDSAAGGNIMLKVNDKKVAEFIGPFVNIPVTNLQDGTNTVSYYASRVYDVFETISEKTNPYREKIKEGKFDPKHPYHNYPIDLSGGAKFVELADPCDIRLAWAETSVREKKITIKAKVSTSVNTEGILSCVIKDAKGHIALKFDEEMTFKSGETTVAMSKMWENPKLWDVGQPNLYYADVKILDKKKHVIDSEPTFRFGFREVWREGREIILNGHPFHMRYDIFVPLTDITLGFLKYIGRNTIYYQPHPNFWWGWFGRTYPIKTKELDMCDENGIAVIYPGPGVTDKGELFDRSLHDSYKRTTEQWVDLFRNRPCILAWGVSMNAYNPKESISPNLMGRYEKTRVGNDGWAQKQASVKAATRLCKEVDPTRLSYGHADGPFGDFAAANCYPNMTPLQEVEEYPSEWAKSGDLPWAAVEYGVFDGSFYKSGSLLLTEYSTTYFGEDAYNRETQMQLEKTLYYGTNTYWLGHGMLNEVVKSTDLYWDFMSMFTSGTDKYWRAYGILGWNHFFWGRYGQHLTPEWKKGQWKNIAKTSATEAPPWASPQVEINRVNMQDMLAFIGGETAYPDKTHLYYAGEEFKKNAVVVWDGANQVQVNFAWAIKDLNGKIVFQGKNKIMASPGKTMQVPITWKIPNLKERGEYTLLLKANNGMAKMSDSFDFTVFPKVKQRVQATCDVYLHDPKGKSQWVKQLMPQVKEFKVGQDLAKGDVLILGREALRLNSLLPYKMEDVENGARILILEQDPNVWAANGFRLVDMVTRIVFETPYSGSLMNDLCENDLRYWRGTPNLLPEFKHVRAVSQPPKGVNRHGVASTVFEIPNVYGFEPLFQCEFDLRYSPLLRLRNGKGAIYYSTFDFTDRVGVDPAATILAKNLLELSLEKTRKATLKVAEAFDEKADILVNTGVVDPKTDEFLNKGGFVLNIALSDAELKKRGIKFEKKKLYRVKLDGDLAAGGATRNMFRWRDYLEVNCITEKGAQCEGVWYRKGKEFFLQVGSSLLEKRYDTKTQWTLYHAVEPTILALDLLKSRVLTILGAAPEPIFIKRLSSICTSLPFDTLDNWFVYGPFGVTSHKFLDWHLEDEIPGEKQAISGDMNPNITYALDPGDVNIPYKIFDEEAKKARFDFRRKVDADNDGFIDLTAALNLKGKSSFCYATHLWKEEKARDAIFSFSFPAKAVIYLNGEKVAVTRTVTSMINGLPPPPLNAISLKLKLKEGENVLTVKFVTLPSTLKGVNWPQRLAVTRAIDGVKVDEIAETMTSCTLYNKKGSISYAYSYHYW